MHGNGFYATPLADGDPRCTAAEAPSASRSRSPGSTTSSACSTALTWPRTSASRSEAARRRRIGSAGALLTLVGVVAGACASGRPPGGARGRARVLDRGGSRAPGTSSPTGGTRSRASASHDRDDVHGDRLPALHARLGQADPDPARARRGQRRHPGPAAQGARRGQDHRPLQESRQRVRAAALDALPRRALRVRLRRRVHPRLLGPGGEREAGRQRGRTGSRPIEDSAGVWPYHDHSPSMSDSIAGGLYGALSILGRDEEPPDREFVVYFGAAPRLQDDQRPRVRREHAGLPREGRRGRAVGRAGDRRRPPHLPRARPPLADPA